MNYLSELFLQSIGNDFTDKSLQEALNACNTEFLSRNVSSQELRDFYDVVKEFNTESIHIPILDAIKG